MFLDAHPEETIRQQLDWLPYRGPSHLSATSWLPSNTNYAMPRILAALHPEPVEVQEEGEPDA